MSNPNFRRHPKRRKPVSSVDGFVGRSVSPIRPFTDLSKRVGGLQAGDKTDDGLRRHLGNFDQVSGLHVRVQPHVRAPAKLSGDNPLVMKRQVAPSPGSRPIAAAVETPKVKPKSRRLKRYVLRGGLAIVVIGAVITGLLVLKGYIQIHKVFRGANTVAALKSNVDPNQLKGEGDGRVNVLLLGVGGAGHDGPDLTDTMLLVSIDPVNNKAALLSIPRDLWVKMPNNFISNYQKINAAYESGKYYYLRREDPSNSNQNAVKAGFSAADQVVSNVLGVKVDYNGLVDFKAFQEGVDIVGGISLNVPTELYDPTIAWENHWNPVIAKAGLQTMNGNQALLYVRSRETSSDFARSQRQRAVLVSLKDKALSLGILSNPFKISQLLSTFGNNVSTDISLSDAEAFYGISQKIGNSDIQSIGLADPPNNYVTTANQGGISVVEPRAGIFDYSAIQTYIRSVLVDGYILKENAKIAVLNGTNNAGLGASTAATLKSYGYNVVSVGNTPSSTYQQTVVVDLTGGKDSYTAHYLEQRFKAKAVNSLPDPAIQAGGANFVIIVGNDEAGNSQT